MCFWQRYAHMAVIGIAVAVILARAAFGPDRGLPTWLGPPVLILALLGSAGLGGFHVGVEFGWWDGPKACAAANLSHLAAIDPNDPLAFLSEPLGPIACSDVVWSFLGVSMAGWNMILSLTGVIGTAYLGFRKAPA